MTNPTIETDLAKILKEIKSDQKGILKEIFNIKKEINSDQKAILKEISDVKVELAEVKGNIKSLDTKVEQLDKRIANQEFTPIRGQGNRGVLVGLILVMLGGLVKLFELWNF